MSEETTEPPAGPVLPCPKCGGGMEQGCVVDNAHGGARLVSEWFPGPPEKSFWKGVRKPDGTFPIGVFRCAGCGYLESYARPAFAIK